MRVAILSDTHVPSRADGIPEWVLSACRAADHVLHAGDVDSPAALSTIESAAPALTAVAGNMDPDALDLPAVDSVTLGGVQFVLTHGTGSPRRYEDRVARTVRSVAPGAVGVAGHTHEVLDATVDGVRLLNPGSATGAAPADEATMLLAEAADGDLSVEVRRG